MFTNQVYTFSLFYPFVLRLIGFLSLETPKLDDSEEESAVDDSELLDLYYFDIFDVIVPWGRSGYHVLSASCWPFFLAACLAGFFFSVGCFLNSIFSFSCLLVWFALTLLTLHFWGVELLYENLYGYHTFNEYENMRFTFLIFLVSEALLFFSFFWSYVYYAISPSVLLGAVWPYFDDAPYDCFGIPFLNTALLVISGFFATHALSQVTVFDFQAAYQSLFCSFVLGLFFLFFQWVEYSSLSFNISSGVFGGLFYLLTGFHGFHVLIGLYLLSWSITRLSADGVFSDDYLGFELTVLYWHFVDVVWLFLYVIVYLWR